VNEVVTGSGAGVNRRLLQMMGREGSQFCNHGSSDSGVLGWSFIIER